MSGTGITFTGCIGAGVIAPSVADIHAVTATENNFGAPGGSLVMGAPTGVKVGYQMVACVTAGTYGAGQKLAFTPDPAWSPVYVSSSASIVVDLYSKIADQDDEDGVASYTWAYSGTDGLAGMTAAHVGWPAGFGKTISNGAVDHGSTPAIPSPGGPWQVAFIAERTSSSFAQPAPEPVVTSTPANLLVGPAGGARAGRLRVYASERADPITGAYLAALDFSSKGLVVAAVSP